MFVLALAENEQPRLREPLPEQRHRIDQQRKILRFGQPSGRDNCRMRPLVRVRRVQGFCHGVVHRVEQALIEPLLQNPQQLMQLLHGESAVPEVGLARWCASRLESYENRPDLGA